MKFEINKDEFDRLSDDMKMLYKWNVDNDGYALDISGLPDVSGLKAKNEKLLEEKSEWSQKNRNIEAAAREQTKEAVEAALSEAKKSGDTTALEKSWTEKYNSRVTEMQAAIDSLNGTVTGLTSGAAASKLANEIAVSGSSDVLLPHIQKRLKTVIQDGRPVTTVLGTDGQASAMTIAELTDEFKTNKAYAPLISGSKGSGGGHNQHDRNNQQVDAGDKSKLSPEQRMTMARENARQH